MTDTPDTRGLEKQLALVQKDMEIMRADLAATLEGFRADIARGREDAAKRDKENQRWVVGFGIAQMVLTISVLGAGFAFLAVLIGLPD
ncbi:MAG: hypothetical protein OXE82_06765 [Rhodobacter sp.]|nr:hypothetical protein [Rhodobacter sp.]